MFGKETTNEIVETLYNAAFDALKEHGHEPNPENLYWFFKGLKESWDETEPTLESLRWKLALQMEIFKIGLKLTPEQKTL